jgi:peroxin-12
MAYNVAYLFDRTPFYRPWLAWIGVDLRRLGVEDFVRRETFLVNATYLLHSSACYKPCVPSEGSTEPTPWHNFVDEAFGPLVAALTFRVSQAPSTYSHIFHQVPRMVVLARLASPILIEIPLGSSRSPSTNPPTPSKGDIGGRQKLWAMPNLP